MDILKISGSAFEIGQQLGEKGKDAWHTKIKNTELWKKVFTFKGSKTIFNMQILVKRHFPDIWQEIVGLAQGLEDDEMNVFLWNCRGDLLASTSDGCTTISGKDDTGNIIVSHNEDGLPNLLNNCFLADVSQNSGTSFFSFVYPASLCGHTFSINSFGIVNTVNNLRLENRQTGLPRQVLARAALNAESIASTIDILLIPPRGGGFHHTLAQIKNGTQRLVSIEATGSQNLIREINHIGFHANHVIYSNYEQQIITESSQARQTRLKILLDKETELNESLCLKILSDTHNIRLPIYRKDKDDPDQENTLASVIYMLKPNKVSWKIFREDRLNPENVGEIIFSSPLSV